MKANRYDGLQVENVFFYIPDFVPDGEGNLWQLHRVSKWTFSPTETDAASITFTAPEAGTLILPPTLVDALEEDDAEVAIYQNKSCVFGPVVAKKEERHGVSTQMFNVKAGDRLRFEIKTLGNATTADWPVSLYYAASWVKEKETFLPDDRAELSRSGFFEGLVKDVGLPCPHHRATFADVADNDPCYNALYELSVRGAIPPQMVQDDNIFPEQSINGYEALSVLVRLWESFRRPIKGAETLLEKAEKLGLPYYNGALSPKQAKTLYEAFAKARKAPVGRTEHGEYSPVYKGVIREDVDIQQLIEEAYYSGASEVTIPEGIYRVPVLDPDRSRVPQNTLFSKTSAMCPHLCLNEMKNFTVRGYGVTLLFQSRPNIGVLISKAENITFEGVTLDYEPQIFTQGLVTEINLEEGFIDFEVEDGYPVDFDSDSYGRMVSGDFYKANGEISATSTGFSYPREMLSHVEGNRYRFTNEKMMGLASGIEAGDYVTFRGEKIANTFYVELTDGFSVTDVTVYTGNVGLSVSYGNDTRRGYYTRYKNIPGPAPLGALVPRLVSTSGTAYHCTGLRQSFTATDCYVRNNGDDGTNIHGVHSRLCADLGDNTYVIAHPNSLGYFAAGDPIRFYDNDYGLLDEAKLVEAELLPESYEPPVDLERNIGVWTFRPRRCFKVRTARPVRCEIGGWVTDEREICQGFELKRCQFIGGRARGILAKAGGVIEDCKVCRRPIGLMAAPEMHWLESDHVFDLTVRNTEVSSCGYGRHPHLDYGVTVHAYATTKSRNILFENCTFADNFRIQFHANKVKDLTLKDCTFKEAPYAYAQMTVDNGENVVIENVTFEGELPVLTERSADARFWSMHKKGRWE